MIPKAPIRGTEARGTSQTNVLLAFQLTVWTLPIPSTILSPINLSTGPFADIGHKEVTVQGRAPEPDLASNPQGH